MFLYRPRRSLFHHSQLRHPSFAWTLAHPEEFGRMKSCHGHKTGPCDESPAGRDPSVLSSSYMQVTEEAERFLLYTDLPGVKAEDLTVEVSSQGVLRVHGERKRGRGEESIKFDRQFMMDEKLVEPSQITARFTDGSLEIVAPKRQPTKPCRVAVVAGSAPVAGNDDNNTIRSFEVDVPGVKIDLLKVEVDDDGKLDIVGERKRGGRVAPIERTFTLDTSVVVTAELEAFLADGVLTIRVPVKAPRENRVVPVAVGDDGKDHELEEASEKAPQDAETTLHDNSASDDESVASEESDASEASVASEVSVASVASEASVASVASEASEESVASEASVASEKSEESVASEASVASVASVASEKSEESVASEESEDSDSEFEVVPETVTEDDE